MSNRWLTTKVTMQSLQLPHTAKNTDFTELVNKSRETDNNSKNNKYQQQQTLEKWRGIWYIELLHYII